jgi:hypothetical protein
METKLESDHLHVSGAFGRCEHCYEVMPIEDSWIPYIQRLHKKAKDDVSDETQPAQKA